MKIATRKICERPRRGLPRTSTVNSKSL
jgi:hypothetical protein